MDVFLYPTEGRRQRGGANYITTTTAEIMYQRPNTFKTKRIFRKVVGKDFHRFFYLFIAPCSVYLESCAESWANTPKKKRRNEGASYFMAQIEFEIEGKQMFGRVSVPDHQDGRENQ